MNIFTQITAIILCIIACIIYLIHAKRNVKNKKLTYSQSMQKIDTDILEGNINIAQIKNIISEIESSLKKQKIEHTIQYVHNNDIYFYITFKHSKDVYRSERLYTFKQIIRHINKESNERYWENPFQIITGSISLVVIIVFVYYVFNITLTERHETIADKHNENIENIIQQTKQKADVSDMEIIEDKSNGIFNEKHYLLLKDENDIYYEASYKKDILIQIERLPKSQTIPK